jgi:hypothetical protein
VNVKVFHNNKPICDSHASYSTNNGIAHSKKPQAVSSPAGTGNNHGRHIANNDIFKRDGPHNNDRQAHISSMTTCAIISRIKKGDQIQIKANYNFNKFTGIKSPEGKYIRVIGITVIYTAADNPAEIAEDI